MLAQPRLDAGAIVLDSDFQRRWAQAVAPGLADADAMANTTTVPAAMVRKDVAASVFPATNCG